MTRRGSISSVNGIIINEIKFSDTSKILNIYTKEMGKINVMARGARRPKSKLLAYTQVFSHCEYELHKGRSWYYINEASMINSFYNIRENLERTSIGFYMMELVNKSTQEMEKSENLFLLLEKSLLVLEKLEEDFLEFIIAFQLKFISFLGYRPHLDSCVLCNSKIGGDYRFSISNSGMLCRECFKHDFTAKKIDQEIYISIVKLLYVKMDELYLLEIEKDTLKKIQRIVEDYIKHSVDREYFNSLDMLKTVLF